MLSRRSLLLAGAAGLVATSPGCGDDEENPDSTPANPAPSSSSEPAVPAAPAGPGAERIGQFRLPERGAPGGLDWNPAGDRLAVTGPSQLAIFPTDGAAPVTAKAHGAMMANSVSWAPDGSRFVTVGTDAVVQFWHGDGAPAQSIRLPAVERHGLVRWSPTGTRVAVSTGSTPMVVEVARDGPGQPVAAAKVEVIYEVAWASDGGSYYVLGAGGVTRNPTAAGPPLATLTDVLVRVWRSIAVAPDGRVVIAARIDNQDVIRVHTPELTSPGPPFAVPAGSSTVTTMRFSPDGRRLVTAFQQGPIGVWEVTGVDGRYLGGYGGHPDEGGGGYGVAWQPGTDRVASLDADGTIHVWRLTA